MNMLRQTDVIPNAHGAEQREILMDHRYTQTDCLPRG